MARTATPVPLVPLSDCGWLPYFRRDQALFEFLKEHRVTLHYDYNERACVTLEDAYRMNEKLKAEAAAAEASRIAEAAKIRERVSRAQQRRQETFTKHYLREVHGRGMSTFAIQDAKREAWILTRISERRLPAEVRDQLGPVILDGLPGAAQFHMMGATVLSVDDLARIDGAPAPHDPDPEGF